MTDEAGLKKATRSPRPRKAIKATKRTVKSQPKPEAETAKGGDAGLHLNPFVSLRALPAFTSRIVGQAASILEEEIATRIVTAKLIEEKYVDVKKLRDIDAQKTMQRFRRDAHDVMDILMDVVNLATNSFGDLTQRVIKVTTGRPTENASKSQPVSPGVIPSLNFEPSVKAGQPVDIPLTLENNGDSPTEEFSFYSSDLLNASGEQISARQISFRPNTVIISPHSSILVVVTVAVPEDASPGTYSGLVQASKLELLRAVLTIRVE